LGVWYAIGILRKGDSRVSHRKDRARAEAGVIFREGRLWEKEEWYALHPTKETLRQLQEEADALAVQKKLDELAALGQVPSPAKTREAVLPYFCTKCKITHVRGKVYLAHKEYAHE